MSRLPVVVLALAATALGAYLLLMYFRRERRPVAIGFHLILGFGALEMMVFVLRDLGDLAEPGHDSNIAVGLLTLSAFLGLTMPMLARRSKSWALPMLAAHTGVGAAGVIGALYWALH